VGMAEAVPTVFVNGLVELKKAVFLCIILKNSQITELVSRRDDYHGIYKSKR